MSKAPQGLKPNIPVKTPHSTQPQHSTSVRPELERREPPRRDDALGRSEAQFRALNDASLLGIFVTDENGDCIYTNANWQRLAGMTAEEALGQGWGRALHPEDRERVFAEWYQATQEQRPFHAVYRYQQPEGTAVWVSVHAAEIREEGAFIGYVGTAEDISEKKQAVEELREAKRFAESLTEHSTSIIYVFDLDTMTYAYSNRDVAEFLGYEQEQIQALGADFLPSIIHPDDLPRMLSHLDDFQQVADGEVMEYEIRYRHVSDTWHWLWNREVVFKRREDGTPCQLMGTAQDITDRKQAEQKLKESHHFIEQIAFASPNILYLYNVAEGRNVYANREVTEVLDYSPAEIAEIGTAILPTLMHPEDFPVVQSHFARLIETKANEARTVEYRMRHKDGTWHWFSSRDVVFSRGEEGSPREILGTAQDITDRKWFDEIIETQIAQVNEVNVRMEQQQFELAVANAQLEEMNARLEEANVQLQALATTDGLTGLKNHRAFQERLLEAVERSRRYATLLSLLLLDVDHFKAYNDTFGHPAGDAVLRTLASLLEANVWVTDSVARYGGEEFALILPETDGHEAMETGERIRAAIALAPWEKRPLTVSVGVTTFTPLTQDQFALIEAADQALYAAKAQGRNRVRRYKAEPFSLK